MVIEKVRKTIEENKLINKKEHIVIGLSGGPDSVCLFNVLMELKAEMELTIHPVHVNHKFRPGAAERDQLFVENLCRERGLQCRTFTVDCNRLAEELHMTGEEAGRKARYDAFYQVAREIDSGDDGSGHKTNHIKIAVAQNANDQAETVLFRLLRGTGVDGLAGIAYKREERGFNVIRPLLDVPRREIEEYCRTNNLEPVTDHTNNESVYARNKIRLELIPYLEKGYNENVKESLVRLSRIAAADKDYLWQQTEKAYSSVVLAENPENPGDMEETSNCNAEAKVFCSVGIGEVVIDREGLAQLHKAIRHRVIFKAFARIGLDKDITEERLQAADFIIEKKQAPKIVQFSHGYRLEVAAGKVRFSKESK